MSESTTKNSSKLAAALNVGVIGVSILLGTATVRNIMISNKQASQVESANVGEHLTAPAGYDWAKHQSTLVIAVRKGCHYCENSIPFYKRLAAMAQPGGSGTQVLMVEPDSKEVAQSEWLERGLPLPVDYGVPLSTFHVGGTPTILLVNPHGTVENVWVGQLTNHGEEDVLSHASMPLSASALPYPVNR